MIKKVVLDKADRLYHFPFDLDDFYPRRALKSREARLPIIDIGHFHWPAKESSGMTELSPLELAQPDDILKLKEALAEWLKTEHHLKVDAHREIYIGHGIRRIVFDLCMAFVESGDIILCPEPGLPVYRRHVIAAGGIPVAYPISERTNFKPSSKRLSVNLGKMAKLLILNNPHNPLGTVLDESDLAELIAIASKQNIFLINDAAYCSLSEEKYTSLLSLPGGDKVALEVFSIPFTFGLPYVPFGFAVGPMEIINGLEAISKTSGVFVPKAWVDMALNAIENPSSTDLSEVIRIIGQSRIKAKKVANRFGWKIIGSNSAPFLWLKIPGRRQSSAFARALLKRRRILTLPGNAFGESGEGYLRLALTASPEDYQAVEVRLTSRLSLRRKLRE